ncbi:MAG: biotin synthase BioB [SAR324 cluster bacterium]|nr:biotin synthase BioB [SAR324 cluster bacterium]
MNMENSERRPTLEEVRELYHRPLFDLIHEAAEVHRRHHEPGEVQLCTLLSVKTGNCPEDCAYCSQSAHYKTDVQPEELWEVADVLEQARRAKAQGSTRFCMATAWRNVRDGEEFDRVLEMVRGVRALGLEACTTLGMLSPEQARRLADAGLTAYNHNLDTSEAYYGKIISTRSYTDRLETLGHVARAGISLCCGAIIGMGESDEDRLRFLHTVATLDPPPESVPINALVPVKGTPLQDQPPVAPLEFVRMIAVARILMPGAMVRLSAGRLGLSVEAQALAFLAGANSIFTGEKLLTTPNPEWQSDSALLSALGMQGRPPHKAPLSDVGD